MKRPFVQLPIRPYHSPISLHLVLREISLVVVSFGKEELPVTVSLVVLETPDIHQFGVFVVLLALAVSLPGMKLPDVRQVSLHVVQLTVSVKLAMEKLPVVMNSTRWVVQRASSEVLAIQHAALEHQKTLLVVLGALALLAPAVIVHSPQQYSLRGVPTTIAVNLIVDETPVDVTAIHVEEASLAVARVLQEAAVEHDISRHVELLADSAAFALLQRALVTLPAILPIRGIAAVAQLSRHKHALHRIALLQHHFAVSRIQPVFEHASILQISLHIVLRAQTVVRVVLPEPAVHATTEVKLLPVSGFLPVFCLDGKRLFFLLLGKQRASEASKRHLQVPLRHERDNGNRGIHGVEEREERGTDDIITDKDRVDVGNRPLV